MPISLKLLSVCIFKNKGLEKKSKLKNYFTSLPNLRLKKIENNRKKKKKAMSKV